jgi:hypothetical protein
VNGGRRGALFMILSKTSLRMNRRTDPSKLLEALGLAKRKGLSRVEIESVLMRSGWDILEQLTAILDPFEMTSSGIAGARAAWQQDVWKDPDED